MSGGNRVSRPGIVFEIRPERREEVMRGGVERADRAIVFGTKTFRLRRGNDFHLARFEPRKPGDRKRAVAHPWLQ